MKNVKKSRQALEIQQVRWMRPVKSQGEANLEAVKFSLIFGFFLNGSGKWQELRWAALLQI